MADKKYDAIVVGSGATGGFAAKELTERGLNVLLLEAGPIHSQEEFEKLKHGGDAHGISPFSRARTFLSGRHIQSQAAFFNQAASFLYVNDWKHPYSHPFKDFYLWIRGKQLGGRFLTWGRVLMRMSDFDFKAASIDGLGENWPICYEDLKPYYDHVETFLGLIGAENGIPNLPDGRYRKTAKLNSMEQDFKTKVENRWSERKVIPWRYMTAQAIEKFVPTTILAAQATGRLTIKADAPATRVIVDEKTGRATAVACVDTRTRREEVIKADLVFLCASTIETIRLLFNSACASHPDGLGNSSGLLGRYFMDQSPSLISGTVPGTSGWEQGDEGTGDILAPNPGGIYIPRFQNLGAQTHPDFARGFNIQGEIGRIPSEGNGPAMFAFMGQGEMLPRYENRVTLHNRRKDGWGVPIPHIRCVPSENELNMLRTQMKVSRELVDENGFDIDFSASLLGLDDPKHLLPKENWLTRTIFRTFYRRSFAIGAAIHECGGVRMGEDPGNSLLNPFNQSWDVKNLYVTDSSCFVSNGACGPTLTTMALTVRAVEHAVKEMD